MKQEQFMRFIRNDKCLDELGYYDRMEAIIALASNNHLLETKILKAIKEYEAFEKIKEEIKI